jgi:HTH-type transcriptional regulator / antitoxin HipB
METKKNFKTLEELEDKYFGTQGTSEREQYEFELSMEILGEKLKQIRKEQKLTQEQLGKMIGVQKAQISKLEKGNNSATISTVLKVFHAMKAKIMFKIEIEEPLNLMAT